MRSAAHAENVEPRPVEVAIPGSVTGMGVELRLSMASGARRDVAAATLRGPRAGDRVQLRHSRGAKPIKEIFSRMDVDAEARRTWPVLEWDGRVVWMRDVDVEAEIPFVVEVRGKDSSALYGQRGLPG